MIHILQIVNNSQLMVSLLNGLYFAAFFFLVGIGISLSINILDFVNFSHTVFMILSLFLTVSIADQMVSFANGPIVGLFIILMIAPLITVGVGLLLDKFVFHPIYKNFDFTYQLLATYGILLMSLDMIKFIWGQQPVSLPNMINPYSLLGQVDVLGLQYPTYNLIVILLTMTIAAISYAIIDTIRLGKMAQAVAENQEMSEVVGINARQIQIIIHVFGIFTVALAGSLLVPTISATPDLSLLYLILGFVVVIIGGVGSLRGTVVGAVIVGLTRSFGDMFFPQFAFATVFLVMAIIIISKPEGIITAEGIK